MPRSLAPPSKQAESSSAQDQQETYRRQQRLAFSFSRLGSLGESPIVLKLMQPRHRIGPPAADRVVGQTSERIPLQWTAALRPPVPAERSDERGHRAGVLQLRTTVGGQPGFSPTRFPAADTDFGPKVDSDPADQPRRCSNLVERSDARQRTVVQALRDGTTFWNSVATVSGDWLGIPLTSRRDESMQAIRENLNTYQGLDGDRQEQLMLLDIIEHQGYEWLNTNPDNPRRGAVLDMLDDVQREHQLVISGGTEDWVGEIPVAEGESGPVQGLWRELLKGAASDEPGPKIVILDTPMMGNNRISGFKAEILSAFARLLSRPTGQELVKSLLTQPFPVVISPLMGWTKLVKRTEHGATEPRSPSASDKQASWEWARRNISETGEITRNEPEVDRAEEGGEPEHFVFVHFKPGLKDSEVFVHDSRDREIVSPAFIALGHELFHAAHMVEGTEKSEVHGEFGAWDDAEERDTIVQGENPLRAEHAITARRHHTGVTRAASDWNKTKVALLKGGVLLVVGLLVAYQFLL